ncbi:MAG: glycine cleavage system aminomethyltransferase GcvT [Deltaproteobacteria bacterium]|nr:glycine cleavage system aminomethyltransferase GcvT [Deltaproteobacteria bacterium]
MTETNLKKTPLHALHVEAGAKMVPFAGYEMPVQYTGVIEEHQNVRTHVGLFDVSHMGEVEFVGSGALSIANKIFSQDLTALVDGQACYAVMCQEDGGIIDDVVIHRLSEQHVLVCVNAANRAKDFAWMSTFETPDCQIRDASDDYVQIAVQGPKAETLLRAAMESASASIDGLKRYHFVADKAVAGVPAAIIARTGYTGEDGFEIYCPVASGPVIWSTLLTLGASLGLNARPIGLAARDSLRLEMRYPLYGQDIDGTTNPFEAGLGWVVKLNKAVDFVGKAALVKAKADLAAGRGRKLIGLEVKGRGIARPHYPVVAEGTAVGEVTSGTMGPSVGKAIAMAYVPSAHAAVGTALSIRIRDKDVAAEVVPTPFYRPQQPGA